MEKVQGRTLGIDHGLKSFWVAAQAEAVSRLCAGGVGVESCAVLGELMIWQVNSPFTDMLIACSSWHLACFSGSKREG